METLQCWSRQRSRKRCKTRIRVGVLNVTMQETRRSEHVLSLAPSCLAFTSDPFVSNMDSGAQNVPHGTPWTRSETRWWLIFVSFPRSVPMVCVVCSLRFHLRPGVPFFHLMIPVRALSVRKADACTAACSHGHAQPSPFNRALARSLATFWPNRRAKAMGSDDGMDLGGNRARTAAPVTRHYAANTEERRMRAEKTRFMAFTSPPG